VYSLRALAGLGCEVFVWGVVTGQLSGSFRGCWRDVGGRLSTLGRRRLQGCWQVECGGVSVLVWWVLEEYVSWAQPSWDRALSSGMDDSYLLQVMTVILISMWRRRLWGGHLGGR